MESDRNIFLIARKGSKRDEDQLTELLAWLTDQVPPVRAVVAVLAGADPATAWDVTTQQTIATRAASGQLDLLLTSSSSTVVVEIKVDAPLGRGQLRKYTDWLKESATTADRHLLTLTPRGYRWPADDISYAEASSVRANSKTWSALRRGLLPLVACGALNERERMLVDHFCAMLFDDIGRVDSLRPAHLQATDNTSVAITNDYYDFFGESRNRVANDLHVRLHRNSESWRRDKGFPIWYGYGEGSPSFAVGFDSVQGAPGLIVGMHTTTLAAATPPNPPTG